MNFAENLKKKLNKKLTKEVAFLIQEDSPSDVKQWIPTGCTELDIKISNDSKGGIPVGKITEISGHEATGKSLLALQIMANAQKMGGYCIYIDTEQGFNTDFAKRVGLDIDNNFMHIVSISVEDVFTLINEVAAEIREKKKAKEKNQPEFYVIVWDTVAATYTQHDLDAEDPDPQASIAMKPRILSKNVPFVLQTIAKYDIAFICLNQLRTIIGAMPGQDPYVSVGGKAIPYYSSVRIRLQTRGKLKDKKDNSIYGMKTKAKVQKTRFGPPHRIAEFPIYFSYGIDDEESMVNVLSKAGTVKKRNAGRHGTQYSFSKKLFDPQATEMIAEYNLVGFKAQLRKNKKYRETAQKLMSDVLIKDMKDPREVELEVVTDEQLEKEANEQPKKEN